ncbi:MAG: tetratricopeptide (TPR) repeat protein [Cyclobacteriaceae bacterium]
MPTTDKEIDRIMSTTMESDLDLIDAYLNGELFGVDQTKFDEKLRNDLKFQSTFQEVKMIRNAVRQNLKANILQGLKDKETLIQEVDSTKNRSIMKQYLSIAASLVLVVTLVYLTSYNKIVDVDGQAIFSENYQAYTNLELGTVRGSEVELNDLKQKAYYAYDLGNFSQAVADLTELVKTEKTAANYFYLGIANTEIGNSEASFANFNTVINNFSEYREQAQWYLSLALLKEGKSDEALSNLVSLSIKGEEKSLDILSSKFGVTLSDIILVVEQLEIRPEDDDNDSPNGVDFEDRRQIQFGSLLDTQSGDEYAFFNDHPIKGLKVGDMVKAVIIQKGQRGKKGQKNKSKGFAFVVSSF